MNHLILWVNAATFAVTAVSLVLSAGVYSRKPSDWMKSYLLYHGAYSLWLLILTYYFFRVVYLPASAPAVDWTVAGLRLAASGVILWAYPGLVMRTIGDEAIDAVLRVVRVVVLVAILAPTSVLVAIGSSSVLLSAVNLVFNGYLLSLTVLALVRTAGPQRPGPAPLVTPVFWVSFVFYLYALIAGSVVIGTGATSLVLNAVSASLYCLPWSLIMSWRLFRDLAAAPEWGMSERFVAEFAITARERQVVEQVVAGLPNKHIARQLEVSLRTVETHLYNVFRKCGVRSRTELIHKIQSGM